jgi:hypothetical protein
MKLAGTIRWEKYNFDVAEKCGVPWMGSRKINKKQGFETFSTYFLSTCDC